MSEIAESMTRLAPATDADGLTLARLLDGWIGTQVARVVALLAVPDHLAAGPLTAAELAAATGAVAGPLARLLAAATVFGLVREDEPGRFALTPVGERLRSDVPGTMRATAVGFLAPPLWQAWGALDQLVQAGVPGPPPWAYFGDHPQDAAWFSRAMGEVTATVITGLDSVAYVPPAAEVIVDVGGGQGTLLASLLSRAPGARGIVLDRPEALARSAEVFAATGVAGRAQAVAGDFFAEVPAGDLHVLSNVLHNWDDDGARRILAGCYRASRPGGGLVVIGMLLPSSPVPSPAYLMDLTMMVAQAGRERTLDELTELAAEAGFTLTRNLPLGRELAWHVTEFRRD
jgi:SAM-dependent methyltransferase